MAQTPTSKEPGKQLSPMMELRGLLGSLKDEYARVLPSHMTVEAFTRNIETAVQEIPALLSCDRKSLLHSCMTAAFFGLNVGRATGQAWILPFGNTAQFIPGYKGLIQMARNTGEVLELYSHAVRENDEFDYGLGDDVFIKHKPKIGGKRGDIIYVYCVAKFRDEGKHIEIMTKEEVDDIRARAQSKNSPAWKNDYEQMARKTVIRRASHYLPMSVQKAIAIDVAAESGQESWIDKDTGAVVIDGTATEIQSASGQLDNFSNGEDAPETATEAPGEAEASEGTDAPENTASDAPAEEAPAEDAPTDDDVEWIVADHNGEVIRTVYSPDGWFEAFSETVVEYVKPDGTYEMLKALLDANASTLAAAAAHDMERGEKISDRIQAKLAEMQPAPNGAPADPDSPTAANIVKFVEGSANLEELDAQINKWSGAIQAMTRDERKMIDKAISARRKAK